MSKVKIVQNADEAIKVMRNAGQWLEDSGKQPSKWWQPKNLNREFLLKYATPDEFYVLMVDDKPAAAAILQVSQNAQDWQVIDKGRPVKALFIHWLCVYREYASTGLPRLVIDFAAVIARSNGIKLLRADTNASEQKLRDIYENLGFLLVAVVDEGYRNTAFYQKATMPQAG